MNVISWSALTPHTLASGGDDGRLRVWDLRALQAPVADFGYHRCSSAQRVLLPWRVWPQQQVSEPTGWKVPIGCRCVAVSLAPMHVQCCVLGVPLPCDVQQEGGDLGGVVAA